MLVVSLRTRLGAWLLGERASAPPEYFFGTERAGLAPQGAQTVPSVLLRNGFSSTQAIASRAIARRISGLELQVKVARQDGAGSLVDEILDDHPLKALLDRPNDYFTGRQIKTLLSYWLTQTGSAYLLKVSNGLGVPAELWPMSPANVEILTGDVQPVVGYMFHGNGGETRYQTEEVVHIFDPDPSSPFEGVGNLGPQKMAFDASEFAQETAREHYRNDAVPKTVLEASAEARLPDGPERTEFAADWVSRFNKRRGSGRGTPAFTPPGFTVKELQGMNFADAVPMMEFLQRQILMANGVPRSVVGDVVDVNRANAETNDFVFDGKTIKPWADLIADAFTVQLATDFDASLFVSFEDFVASDKDFDLRKRESDLATKLTTINEVREDEGLEPVPWGELPVGTIGEGPYTGEKIDDPFATEPEQESDLEEPEEPGDDADLEPDRSLVVERFHPDLEWQRFLAREKKYTPHFRGAMRRVFAEQRDQVIAALEQRSSGEGLSRGLIDTLLDPDLWRRAFAKYVEPLRKRAFLETASETMGDLVGRDFIYTHEVDAMLRKQGAGLVSMVNETTRARLTRQLRLAFEAGDSEAAVTARVRSVFQERRNNAQTIARTEVARATQAAQLSAFSQSGVVGKKRWNTARDSAVRDTHEATNGQIVDQGEPFILGDGEQADAPGLGASGRSLSPGNAINCRCFVSPVID